MRVCLSAMTRYYKHAAEWSVKASRATHWALVVCSAASVASGLATAPFMLPLSGVAAGLAVSATWLTARSRRQEREALRFLSLRDRITLSFGPAGQVLRPSEYYSASTEGIESLLGEIRADRERP